VQHRIRIGTLDVDVVEAETPAGLPLLLICCVPLFGREGDPYLDPDGRDWHDNAERFALFSRAIAWLSTQARDWHPDLLHLNDWQTALAAALLPQDASRPATVFSIHNLSYQGLFDAGTFERLGLPSALWSFDALEFYHQLSFIKGGLSFADALTTVSPSYAREIQTPEFGCGLEGLLRHRAEQLHGILNGIDTEIWDPARDPLIEARYDIETIEAKAHNKTALKSTLGLAPGPQPLLAMISRLVPQKGVDLVLEALPALLALEAQLVILGTGDVEFQHAWSEAARQHPGHVAYRSSRDEQLAHRIEAGADMFLMPSRFEPCGLNQMYSMRYGTVPIARRTGGLADTVAPVDDGLDHATGFVFEYAASDALVTAVAEALQFFRKPAMWRRLQANGMSRDFSWHGSAERYLALYRDLLVAPAASMLDTNGHERPAD
jgi:starch synthase